MLSSVASLSSGPGVVVLVPLELVLRGRGGELGQSALHRVVAVDQCLERGDEVCRIGRGSNRDRRGRRAGDGQRGARQNVVERVVELLTRVLLTDSRASCGATLWLSVRPSCDVSICN